MSATLLAHSGTARISRQELQLIDKPEATKTHQPLAHHEIVDALLETLSFRHIHVTSDEYAVSLDGMRMFGVLCLETEFRGVRFAIGIRNANDKSMRFALTVGYKVLVCDNMAFMGDFMPVFHKHTRWLDLIEVVSIGVDKIQRNFEPLKKQISDWQLRPMIDEVAKVIIYNAFFEDRLPIPRHLAQAVHKLYFQPELEEFQPRTLWSLSNAFTSAFKKLNPMAQFKATAKLAVYLDKFSNSPQHRSLSV
jgi:hypothetical protein